METLAVIPIRTEEDIIIARKMGRELAQSLHFDSIDKARIVTAVSELARNIYRYAGDGHIQFEPLEEAWRVGLKIIAADNGPGIPDIQKALSPGYSTSGGLGAGIPGVKTMMDEFYIESHHNEGTKITAVKWQTIKEAKRLG
ncbi:anti-sigma regulatory factor [Metabacillus sp. GX 13764]|uniref:anti-sigma regulatory factor n=1 Tax=Metabacillus kandeliae TaxID=2900151 RepID=UPI001E37B69D|nr:anti-sigma regulatory factor [Metabacillus kandeliae]MCD7034239.1 anti-sigma regulatory factor [Metabacillus kandeliae]